METINEELRNYIVCIGNDGFEAMLEVPDEACQSATAAALKGLKSFDAGKFGGDLRSLGLRLRFNSHRCIQAYVVSIDIEPDLFYEMLQDKYTQDLIITKGVKINL